MKPSIKKQPPALRNVCGEPSWRLASTSVEAFVTESGGHVGPVTFDRRGRKIQPYSVAPWAGEKGTAALEPILRVLRGDFFCLPFGGNATKFRGEKHPAHGETANARWRFEALESTAESTCLHLSLKTKVLAGRVDKRIYLRAEQNVIYSEHVISGMTGPMALGHHAMLKFPEQPGSGLIATSPFVYGQVFPGQFEQPENGGYSSLKPGAEFCSLQQVPALVGPSVDLGSYPARQGFEDLIMLVNDPGQDFAWTTVAFPRERYVWFALKNPQVLRHTVLWISNRGRHYPPWNSRHVRVMGLEEVTSYFHLGIAESAQANPLSERGFPTCITLDPVKPLVVRYLMGIASIPKRFDRVKSVRADESGAFITLQSESGAEAKAAVDIGFIRGEPVA